MFNLRDIIRPHLATLKPYSSARDEYKGNEGIFLDANENALGSATTEDFNRYPDPYQWQIKDKLAIIKAIAVDNIFLGNGSDEAIDLLFRLCCRPSIDNVIILPPTYGMYDVSANINDVEVRKVLLNGEFQINVEAVLQAVDAKTKLIFICSPNNPTGNNIDVTSINRIIESFSGIVVIDEAYVDFSTQASFIQSLRQYPNVVVLQTFSKAWGLAGLRLGMAFASEAIIALMNRIKPPYNVNSQTQKIALEALANHDKVKKMVKTILQERLILQEEMKKLAVVEEIFPSDANFIMVRVKEAKEVYKYLVTKMIIVRDRSSVQLCDNALRITVGTADENRQLLQALSHYDYLKFPDSKYFIA